MARDCPSNLFKSKTQQMCIISKCKTAKEKLNNKEMDADSVNV